ncbi:MAG: hypothetical protein AB1481_05410 [Candidatus Omnitrophota bacterium]
MPEEQKNPTPGTKACRYCKEEVAIDDPVCHNCGYDFKTDAINPSFKDALSVAKRKHRKKQREAGSEGPVSSGVKKFAFIGLAVVIFSVLYKYNFNVVFLKDDIASLALKYVPAKWRANSTANKSNSQPTVFENVKSYKASQEKRKYRELVIEGIFFSKDTKPFVIINGQVLSEGDVLGKFLIRKINPDTIEVFTNGEIKVLGLKDKLPLR